MLITAKHNLPIYLCNRTLSVFTVNRFVLTVYLLVWSLQIAFNGKTSLLNVYCPKQAKCYCLLVVCRSLDKRSPFSTYRLYSCVEGHEPVVLIIKTLDEEVTITHLQLLLYIF